MTEADAIASWTDQVRDGFVNSFTTHDCLLYTEIFHFNRWKRRAAVILRGDFFFFLLLLFFVVVFFFVKKLVWLRSRLFQ